MQHERTEMTAGQVARGALHRAIVVVGALLLTLTFFLVLPLMQTIAKVGEDRMNITSVGRAFVPPPPEPEDEPEEEEEEAVAVPAT